MNGNRLLALAALLTGFAPVAAAQRMTVRPTSDVVLAGTSNINRWACRSNVFEATISLEQDGGFILTTAAQDSRVAVTVPVQSLKCGNKRMDQDLYDALDAARFPAIEYRLVNHQVEPVEVDGHFAALTYGDITVAGVTRRVEIPVRARRLEDGTVAGEGIVKLRMTDFGVQPPVALLGLIRARNDIEVSFRVLLDTTTIAALARR
jgi:polyisoprenoid-binding protein YceI